MQNKTKSALTPEAQAVVDEIEKAWEMRFKKARTVEKTWRLKIVKYIKSLLQSAKVEIERLDEWCKDINVANASRNYAANTIQELCEALEEIIETPVEPAVVFTGLPEGTTHVGQLDCETSAGGSIVSFFNAFKYVDGKYKVYVTDTDNEHPRWTDTDYKNVYSILPEYKD